MESAERNPGVAGRRRATPLPREGDFQAWSWTGGARLRQACDGLRTANKSGVAMVRQMGDGRGASSSASVGSRYSPSCAISWQIGQSAGVLEDRLPVSTWAALFAWPDAAMPRAPVSKCTWVWVTRLCQENASSAANRTAAQCPRRLPGDMVRRLFAVGRARPRARCRSEGLWLSPRMSIAVIKPKTVRHA